MAYTTTSNLPMKMPVPGSREPAQIALLNENTVATDAHDHTTGKGVAIGRMRSGLQANRPAAGQAGNVYFATDTGKFYVDSGAAWVEFLTTGGTSTITGWTLVDPIIRDTLNFGPEPTGTPDATLSRTGPGALRVDTHLGVGVAPAGWSTGWPAVQTAQAALAGNGIEARLLANSVITASTQNALQAGTGGMARMNGASFEFWTAPSVAAGAAQTFTQRLNLAPSGTLTLTPDAGQIGLSSKGMVLLTEPSANAGTTVFFSHADATWEWGIGTVGDATRDFSLYDPQKGHRARWSNTTGTLTLTPDAGASMIETSVPNSGAAMLLSHNSPLYLRSQVVGVMCPLDNYNALGDGTHRWTAVYAVAGAINTSSRQFKEGITPLDPAACYQAAKDVRWYEFAYLPPVYQEPEPPPEIAYDAADDNETKAEKKARRDEAEAQSKAAHLKMVAETAPARHQRGFVFPAGADAKDEAGGTLPPVPDLFGLSDRESTTPQADIATLGAALQHLIAKVEALEAASGQAPAA